MTDSIVEAAQPESGATELARAITVSYGTECDQITRNAYGDRVVIRSGARMQYEPTGEALRLFLKPRSRKRRGRRRNFRRLARAA